MGTRITPDKADPSVNSTLLADEEGDLERLLIAGSIVERSGSHYRIKQGEETLEDLDAQARHRAGMCDCGAVLSRRGERSPCRTCGREYRT